jgi:hypothetical protein
MPDSDFVILKRERKIPSLAMCDKCKIKFFTPHELTNNPREAAAYLFRKFAGHNCTFATFPSPFRKKASNQ